MRKAARYAIGLLSHRRVHVQRSFEADANLLEEAPECIARNDDIAPLGELVEQGMQRNIWLLVDPRQHPISLLFQQARPPPAHRLAAMGRVSPALLR